MERVYDKYQSDIVQGDCYKYIKKCRNCGKVIFEVRQNEYNLETLKNIPNFCSECGTKR